MSCEEYGVSADPQVLKILWTYSIDLLLLALQLLRNLVHLLQILQVTLHPVYLACIAPSLQLLDRLVGVLFFVREK